MDKNKNKINLNILQSVIEFKHWLNGFVVSVNHSFPHHNCMLNFNQLNLFFSYFLSRVCILFYHLFFVDNFSSSFRKNKFRYEKLEVSQPYLGVARFQDFIKVSTWSTCFTAWTFSYNTIRLFILTYHVIYSFYF